MKLGLITDIHEHVEHLRAVLDCFRRERVEQVVVIGDLFETGERIEETCRLLSEADAVGVWGNHDFGLCFEPDAEVRARYSPTVTNYMLSLRGRLELDGCLFTHVEPWLNPEVLHDLWYFDGPPDEPHKLARIFDAALNRWMFAGHYHRWLLATPTAIADWAGGMPIRLDSDRYFVVIGAVCEGRFAVFNTQTLELRPFNI